MKDIFHMSKDDHPLCRQRSKRSAFTQAARERKKSRMKHRACLEQHSRTHMAAPGVMKVVNEDRKPVEGPREEAYGNESDKQQMPTCWVKAIHPGLLGDTYAPKGLRRCRCLRSRRPMLLCPWKMKTNRGQMLLLNVLCHFGKGHGDRLIAKRMAIILYPSQSPHCFRT